MRRAASKRVTMRRRGCITKGQRIRVIRWLNMSLVWDMKRENLERKRQNWLFNLCAKQP